MVDEGNKPVLPTIITTDSAAATSGDAQGEAAPPAAASTSSSGHNHGRNFSISSMGGSARGTGHTRSSSLQVPGTANAAMTSPASGSEQMDSKWDNTIGSASPTLSTTSELSSTGLGEGTPFRTALALRDNDPRTNQHGRQISIASVFTTDTSQPDRNPASSITGHDDATATAKGSVKGESSHNNQPEDEAERARADSEQKSSWARLKTRLIGHTRGGRRIAQAKELEEAKKRQREMDPIPFVHRPIELADLVDPKSVAKLRDMGGVKGLVAALGTDAQNGLQVATADVDKDRDVEASHEPGFVNASIADRERVYGRNMLPQRKSKSLLLLMWLALQDKILILLCVAAVVSLALGLYSDFGAPPEYDETCPNPPPGLPGCPLPQVDWVEGVAILVAVIIVDVVGSLNDWQKERQFKKLNAQMEERVVKVIRGGDPTLLNVHEIQVGDILQLEPGDVIPVDGVFLRGHNVKCDESGATGESDMIRKVTYDECLADLEAHERTGEKLPRRDCFLLSGSRVLEGVGDCVVIAVGTSSFNGKLMMSLRTDSEITPLQGKLNRLAEIIAYAGSGAGIVLFVALMIRFLVQITRPSDMSSPSDKAQRFIDILIQAVVIIVVAVPEGLPLATTLALAFATKRMTKENLLVRLLSACETSANCSVICTDKTGTLTQNEMSVVAGSIGVHLKFAYNLEDNKGRVDTNQGKTIEEKDKRASQLSIPQTLQTRRGRKDWAVDQHELNEAINEPLQTLFNDAIAINSTAFEEESKTESEEETKVPLPSLLKRAIGMFKKTQAADKKATEVSFVGSKTETALLKMAKELHWENYRQARERHEVVTSFPFSSERKAMAVVVRRADGGYRMFVKGASEILNSLCSHHVKVTPPVEGQLPSSTLETEEFDEESRDNVAKTIIFYANQTLRTIAVCYRDFESWPPQDARFDEDGLITYQSLAEDMTLIAITGIEDPLRPGVRNAVTTCAKAGVQVKMCTGDNALTARSIATQCGIYSPGGIIMEGPVFRNLSEPEMMMVVPRLQVLARCSPEDKKILVECLKSMDSVVGVTGDGTNDAPALKTANVGFSMGIAGTEVAREASDIILMDDNFESIVTAIMWGRSVNDAVRRFLQFQLSVNIGAVGITFITAVADSDETSVFSAVQLLWINLIMDTLAALALATDPASPELLDRKPDRRDAPLISTDMWKMIVGQSIFQFAVVLVLNFAGYQILGLNKHVHEDEQVLGSLIFNLYVWCQLFNQVNCRSLTRDLNFFKGLHRNVWFMGIVLIEVALQILISYKGGQAFSVVPMGGREWGITIIAGILSWPVGVLVRLIPTEPIDRVLIQLGLMPDPDALPKHSPRSNTFLRSEAEKTKAAWEEPAIGQVAEKLSTYARLRGGRSRLIPLGKSRATKMREADVHPQTLMALVPALIGASVGGGWRPSNPPEASVKDPSAGNPSLSSWQLYQGGHIQVHPETDAKDDFLTKLKGGSSK